jgi:DNA-binding LytR/AlgR family response regulator
MFLDIEMPGLSGLEVAHAASGRCHVVFVTAYDAHAVKAFEQGAVDYVMKPFSAARLATAVARLRERLAAAPPPLEPLLQRLAEQAPKRPPLRWINASQGSTVRLITTDEVCYFKSDSKYTLVVTADGEAVIRTSVKELLDELDPELFWLVHRGVIVNVNAIALARRKLNGQFELKLKTRPETLLVSEPFAYRFRQM